MKKFLLLLALAAAALMPQRAPAVEIKPLPLESIARYKATHVITVTAADIRAATNAATQNATTNQIFPITGTFFSNGIIADMWVDVPELWAGSNTNANTNVTFQIGDYLSSNAYFGNINVGSNVGSVAVGGRTLGASTNTTRVYTNANALVLTCTSTNLGVNANTNLITGKLKIYFRWIDPRDLRNN